MTLSVVIPCYNERATIETLVDAVRAVPVGGPIEIIVVDDASTDGTQEILRQRIEPKVARVVYSAKNGGKGAALRTGLALATGDIVIIQDADLEYDPQDYPKLIRTDRRRRCRRRLRLAVLRRRVASRAVFLALGGQSRS